MPSCAILIGSSKHTFLVAESLLNYDKLCNQPSDDLSFNSSKTSYFIRNEWGSSTQLLISNSYYEANVQLQCYDIESTLPSTITSQSEALLVILPYGEKVILTLILYP